MEKSGAERAAQARARALAQMQRQPKGLKKVGNLIVLPPVQVGSYEKSREREIRTKILIDLILSAACFLAGILLY